MCFTRCVVDGQGHCGCVGHSVSLMVMDNVEEFTLLVENRVQCGCVNTVVEDYGHCGIVVTLCGLVL